MGIYKLAQPVFWRERAVTRTSTVNVSIPKISFLSIKKLVNFPCDRLWFQFIDINHLFFANKLAILPI